MSGTPSTARLTGESVSSRESVTQEDLNQMLSQFAITVQEYSELEDRRQSVLKKRDEHGYGSLSDELEPGFSPDELDKDVILRVLGNISTFLKYHELTDRMIELQESAFDERTDSPMMRTAKNLRGQRVSVRKLAHKSPSRSQVRRAGILPQGRRLKKCEEITGKISVIDLSPNTGGIIQVARYGGLSPYWIYPLIDRESYKENFNIQVLS